MSAFKTFEFDVTIRFEAKEKGHALVRADKIMKLLENGSPQEALANLDMEARFAEAKNIRETNLPVAEQPEKED